MSGSAASRPNGSRAPSDERYLSLSSLQDAVRSRAERATARTVETKSLRVEARTNDVSRLSLAIPGCPEPVAPTHWSFGQLCGLVGAPAGYLRQLSAPLAGINLQHGLASHRAELVKTLEADDGRIELRAVTGPDYGRIWDHELVEAVMRIAGDGVGDTRWKVRTLSQLNNDITDHVKAASDKSDASDSSANCKREDPRKSRKKWSKHHNEQWPKDPSNPAKNQDAENGKDVKDLPPTGILPTKEHARMLDSRLDNLERDILPQIS